MQDQPWLGEFSLNASEEDILACFRLILGRRPHDTEWPGHRTLAGHNLAQVVASYLSSPEFEARKLLQHRSSTPVQLVDVGPFEMYVSPDDAAVGKHLSAGLTYERAVTEAFCARLSPGDVCVDIGANIGWFTMWAAHIVGSTGSVYAIEPGAQNARLLTASCRVNLFDNVNLVPVAASNDWGSLIYRSAFSNGFVTASDREDVESLLDSNIVAAAPLDKIVPADREVRVIKIDVEGYEFTALRGAEGIIRRCRPTMFVEFTPGALEGASGISGPEFLNYLRSFGYAFTALMDGGNVDCGSDVNAVMTVFNTAKLDHIDLLVEAG